MIAQSIGLFITNAAKLVIAYILMGAGLRLGWGIGSAIIERITRKRRK
jgi:hypothetical protein